MGEGEIRCPAIQTLRQHVAFGAFHNSHDRYDAPKCLPRPREAVFREISQWIHNTSIQKPILWLYGPAGSGKSAIAQSIAEKAQEMNYLLVGTYFFNRSDEQRDNAARLIPSLAHQLTLSVPSTREHVLNIITQDPGVFSLNFRTQMQRLILQPLIAAGVVRQGPDDAASLPMMIIIDGLDECQKSDERTEVLQALIASCQDPLFPLIILCHSRPESDIRAAFNHPQTSELSARLVLDDKFNPGADIQTFLNHHFAEIKAKHILRAQIPDYWPPCTVINDLVRKSSGQLIYASTAVKHITSRKHNPMKRLETLLTVGGGSDISHFKGLDALYQLVLSSFDEDDRNIVGRMIGMISFSPKLAHREISTRGNGNRIRISPATIDQVLNLEAGKTLLLMDDLHSLIDVCGPDDHLRPFHSSLGDFLRDRSRSGPFHVDPGLPPADHLLAYFKCLLNASTSATTLNMEIAPPSRDHFSEASLTVELLEFCERFPWEHILTENLPRGSLSDRSKVAWIRYICELYTFCKTASTKSPVWAAVYHRALRGLVAWVDCEMAHPSSPQYYVLRRYMNHLNLLDDFILKDPYSNVFDVMLDVLQTPSLSCLHHIGSKPHNSLILKTILEGLSLNRFPHAEGRSRISCPLSDIKGRRCCQKCRLDIAYLINLSDRTSYLDILLPYIETELCRPDWVSGEDQYDSVGELKAAISRYKKKPIPDYYNYNSRWDADIPFLRSSAAQVQWTIPHRRVELSDVLPFQLNIFE